MEGTVPSKGNVPSNVLRSAKQLYGYRDDRCDLLCSEQAALDEIEISLFEKNSHCAKVRNVPVEILSPATIVIWMSLCPNWRTKFDYNFQRDNAWTDDRPVLRFNDTFYVKYHNILDWHDFIMLKNGTMLYSRLTIKDTTWPEPLQSLWYVTEVCYTMKDELRNTSSKSEFVKQHDISWWQPNCVLRYKRLARQGQCWVLHDVIHTLVLTLDETLEVVDYSVTRGNVVQHVVGGGRVHRVQCQLREAVEQHPDVKAGKPCKFAMLGTDKYHHTQFTGKHNWDTHGLYMWFCNFDARLQFAHISTWTLGQVSALVSTNSVLRALYTVLTPLLRYGILTWTGDCLEWCRFMISHQITDMQDRDHLLRKRGSSGKSRTDGCLWYGFEDGAKWPEDHNDLMEAGCVIPGPYLYTVWRHLYDPSRSAVWGRNRKGKVPASVGMQISLTQCTKDIYNGLPIASTLKSTIEINHTTVLGFLNQAFKLEWINVHNVQGYQSARSLAVMKLFLRKYLHMVNGFACSAMQSSFKIFTFNQMHHAYAKLLQFMLALPAVINHHGHFDLVWALLRLTGALQVINTENDRLRLKEIAKPVLVEVDRAWGSSMSTPKMRGFKQFWLTLKLFNNNTFVDGKKVEQAHQMGKDFQQNHNVFKESFKSMVSRKSFDLLVLLFVLNGGHWGDNWQYFLGRMALRLRHPLHADLPHPALQHFKIPFGFRCPYQCENTLYYASCGLDDAIWDSVLSPARIPLLVPKLAEFFEMPDLRWSQVWDRMSAWVIKRVKCWRFHDDLRSFHVNFENEECEQVPARGLVKVISNRICEFVDILEFEYMGMPTKCTIMFGRSWPLHEAVQPRKWYGNKCNSMPYVDMREVEPISCVFDFHIVEPVIMIHNCVSFLDVKSSLPSQFQHVSNIKFYKKLQHYCHKAYCCKYGTGYDLNARQKKAIELPCGPTYKCKAHGNRTCGTCPNRNLSFASKRWMAQWECNTHLNPHFWVFDCQNGLAWGLTTSERKWGQNQRFEWYDDNGNGEPN